MAPGRSRLLCDRTRSPARTLIALSAIASVLVVATIFLLTDADPWIPRGFVPASYERNRTLELVPAVGDADPRSLLDPTPPAIPLTGPSIQPPDGATRSPPAVEPATTTDTHFLVLGDAQCTATTIATDGDCWAHTSGGATAAGVPGTGNACVADANSGAGTGTLDATLNCASLNTTAFTGTVAVAAQVFAIVNDVTHAGGTITITTGTFQGANLVLSVAADITSTGACSLTWTGAIESTAAGAVLTANACTVQFGRRVSDNVGWKFPNAGSFVPGTSTVRCACGSATIATAGASTSNHFYNLAFVAGAPATATLNSAIVVKRSLDLPNTWTLADGGTSDVYICVDSTDPNPPVTAGNLSVFNADRLVLDGSGTVTITLDADITDYNILDVRNGSTPCGAGSAGTFTVNQNSNLTDTSLALGVSSTTARTITYNTNDFSIDTNATAAIEGIQVASDPLFGETVNFNAGSSTIAIDGAAGFSGFKTNFQSGTAPNLGSSTMTITQEANGAAPVWNCTSGDVTVGTSTVVLNVTGSENVRPCDHPTFFNVTFNANGSAATYTNVNDTYDATGAFTVSDAESSVTVIDAFGGTFSDFVVGTNGTYQNGFVTANLNGPLVDFRGGSCTCKVGGTFDLGGASAQTIYADGDRFPPINIASASEKTFRGDFTTTSFTKDITQLYDARVRIEAGTTWSVTGATSTVGAIWDTTLNRRFIIYFSSTLGGERWNFSADSPRILVRNVYIQDSENISAAPRIDNVTDGGGNVGWDFTSTGGSGNAIPFGCTAQYVLPFKNLVRCVPNSTPEGAQFEWYVNDELAAKTTILELTVENPQPFVGTVYVKVSLNAILTTASPAQIVTYTAQLALDFRANLLPYGFLFVLFALALALVARPRVLRHRTVVKTNAGPRVISSRQMHGVLHRRGIPHTHQARRADGTVRRRKHFGGAP